MDLLESVCFRSACEEAIPFGTTALEYASYSSRSLLKGDADVSRYRGGCMEITVGAWNVARVHPVLQYLQPLVGGYELAFQFEINVLSAGDLAREATIVGAQVSVKTGMGERRLGFSRLDMPLFIRQTARSSQAHATFFIELTPSQIWTIEELRFAEVLTFAIAPRGVGREGEYESPLHSTWTVEIPRSRWLQMLREARALDVLLVEIPMPVADVPDRWRSVTASFLEAERQFHFGEYTAAVVSCRKAVQGVGEQLYGLLEWAGPSLDLMEKARRDMSKEQREAAVLATVRHLTHLAAHTGREGGVVFSRDEARLILALTAAIVASSANRGAVYTSRIVQSDHC